MSQNASTRCALDIDAGNGILYFVDEPFSSFSSAIASTKWRKLGMMKDQVNLQVPREFLEFYSGVPSALQAQYVTAEDVMLGGNLLEGSPENVARILGGMDLTYTTKASSPVPTTVLTGSTKSSIIVADSTGYAAGDQIQVGTGASAQYGRIRSIDTATDTFTLYEGLDNDVTPDPGAAVAKVDQVYFDLGTLTAPDYIALKFSHTFLGGYGSFDLYILKAQIKSNFDTNFQDNTKTPESIGYGFQAMSIKDPEVESGKTARWLYTQT
jgi:hypothetical protein